MSENSTYQLLRSHLSNLRLSTAAEALPSVLEQAKIENLGHTAMLERLLSLEVQATEQRRRASLASIHRRALVFGGFRPS